MITTVFGTKLGSTRQYLENGMQIPVTYIQVEPAIITEIIPGPKSGYLLAVGTRKHTTKPIEGIMKKAGIDKKPRFLRKIHVEALDESLTVGSEIKIENVLAAGDNIAVTGISKGKGFAGVVKRHGFAGGPRTHGQSDRWRSPGSIGAGTTPGRVLRGLRMAGRMGSDTVTVKGLKVVAVSTDTNILTVSGLIPGAKQSIVQITKA